MARRANPTPDAAPADVALLYQAHRSELKGFIARRVNSPEEAEDILQNVFYHLARIDLVENPIEHISSWLYRAARNQIIDRHRKHKEERMPTGRARAKDDDDFLGDLSELLAVAESDPETEYMGVLIRDEVERALAELPAEQRSVFALTEQEGFSFKEISKSTGVPVNTLLSRKRYAVLHLRGCLQALYDELWGE